MLRSQTWPFTRGITFSLPVLPKSDGQHPDELVSFVALPLGNPSGRITIGIHKRRGGFSRLGGFGAGQQSGLALSEIQLIRPRRLRFGWRIRRSIRALMLYPKRTFPSGSAWRIKIQAEEIAMLAVCARTPASSFMPSQVPGPVPGSGEKCSTLRFGKSRTDKGSRIPSRGFG